MADDLRVPLDPIFDAFGVPVTVTRPAPLDIPIETTGVWVPADSLEQPTGLELARAVPLCVMSFQRSAVSELPVGSEVLAPQTQGGTVETWTVDSIVRVRADEIVAVLHATSVQGHVHRSVKR